MRQIANKAEYEAIMARVNEYLSGKSLPTLQIAQKLHKKLNIDANLILGAG